MTRGQSSGVRAIGAPELHRGYTIRFGTKSDSSYRWFIRWTQLIAGLFLFGFSAALMIRSGLGVGPWDAFHLGLAEITRLSIGGASVLVGLLILCGTYFLGVRPGPGTIANMILIGIVIDLLLPLISHASGWIEATSYHVAGIALMGLATGMYIAPRLGEGPRDGLMLGLAAVTGRSVTQIRAGVEITVLMLGWVMGGTVGIGTVLFALGIGPAVTLSLRIFRVPQGLRA